MNTKIALVTGASRGLGKDMAIALAGKGMDVVITYRTQKVEAEKVASEIQAKGRKASVLFFDAADVAGLDGFVGQLKETLKHWNTDKIDF